MPSVSSARRRSESVRGLIPWHECSSSVKRRAPSERSCTSTAVHFAPRISAQAATEQVESWIGFIVRTSTNRNGARPEGVVSIPVSQLDNELQERIDEPVSEEAERETRLSPADATAQMRIKVPAQRNAKLRTLLERVNADDGLKARWHVANVNAIKRLGINDHSWVHIQIVANIGLRLLRILTKRGVEPAMIADYGMKREDAEVVVVLGALLHCIGMAVHRDRHEDWSLFLAEPKMRELLARIYEEPELTVVASEVLQAITSHRDYGKPLTIEAGIVRVADALDMAKGRSRIPFERGSVSIHSLSAAAIDDVEIKDGEAGPILIEILMNNSSGIYQVDGLLKAKLRGSGLEPYVEVVAHIDTEAEKRLVSIYRLET